MRWYKIDGKWVLGKGSKAKPPVFKPRLTYKEQANLKHLKAIKKGGN